MYLKYFGLSEKPFNITPDPAFLYLGLQYEEVLTGLVEAIRERKGLLGLVGEAGSGKTTLINAVLERLDPKTKTAFLFNFSRDVPFGKMLDSALVELGVAEADEPLSRVEAVQRLHSFAIQQLVSGGNVLLVVDEAQSLSPEVMESLRLLSNLETRKHKLVQILLAGQSGLRRFLETPGLENVNERIGKWFHLCPMGKYELAYYIRHRLSVAGSQGGVRFDRRAFEVIYDSSRGNPRRVNTICDRALLIACCKGESLVGKQTVIEAVGDIDGGLWRRRVRKKWLSQIVAPATAAMLIGFSIGNFAERDLGVHLSHVLSTIERVASVQSRAFISGNPPVRKKARLSGERPPSELEAAPKEDNRPLHEAVRKDESLFFDKQASLVKLFRLFKLDGLDGDSSDADVYPGLFSLESSPDVYREMRQPFRVRVKGPEPSESAYLLVTEVITNGVIALDKDGNEQQLSDDGITSIWDGEVSWIYPFEAGNRQLNKGMSGGQVLRLQEMLRKAGYDVSPTGVFDEMTDVAVMALQKRLGLKADGIVGNRTKALLYQIVG